MPEPQDPTLEPAATGPDRLDDASFAPEAEAPLRPDRARARRVALLSLRLVAGTVAVAAAVATVATVGLAGFPTVGLTPGAVTVTPVPADELRTCAGATMRLGDESGANADTPVAIGVPSVRAGSLNSSLQRDPIAESDAGIGGTPAAPEILRISPADGAELGGAQSQVVDVNNFKGFSTAACAEPSGSVWLVGGSTVVGRTSILILANPTEVSAIVSLSIYGEKGAIEAPGLTGIDVPAGSERVLSLAGFAPGLVSPVVHVEARGGQVVAYLQQSIVRGLDATGLDLVDAAPDPATDLTFPGIRIFDALATGRALSLDDWDDAAPVVRIFNPGTAVAKVTVSVTPLDDKVEGTSFPVDAEPGVVTDIGLDAGIEVDSGVALDDGTYTVTMSADTPVVGAVRVTAAADIGEVTTPGVIPAPVSDFAWYSASPQLDSSTLVAVAPGPDPQIVAFNPTSKEIAVVLEAQGGADITLVVPAGAAKSTKVVPGTAYVVRDPGGLYAAVSYASDDRMGAYPITTSRPVSGSIVIRP